MLLDRWSQDIEYQSRLRCGFGLTEAAAAVAAAIPELFAGGAGAGAGLAGGGAALAGAGADIGLDAGLAAGTAGLAGDALAGAGGAFGDTGGLGALFGGDVGAGGAGGALSGAGGALSPAATPALAAAAPTLAAGTAPAAAGPIDLASNISALSNASASSFDLGPFGPATASSGPWTDTSAMFAQGFGPETGVVSPASATGIDAAAPLSGISGAPGPVDTASLLPGATPGAAPAAAPGSDLSTLLSSNAAAPATTPGSGLAGAGGASGTAAPGASNAFSLNSLVQGAENSVLKNPLGIAAGAAGLGYSVIQGQKLTANQQALENAAATQSGQANQLASYLQNGTLPAGLAASVANATAAAKAQIISGYASRGQSADPSQNSALAQELAQVDMNASAMQGQLATQLLSQGITEANISDQLYAQLVQMDQTQAKNVGTAIANFSSALAGGPRTIQLGTAGVTA